MAVPPREMLSWVSNVNQLISMDTPYAVDLTNVLSFVLNSSLQITKSIVKIQGVVLEVM